MNKHAPRFDRLPIPAALARSFAAASLLLPSLAFAGGPSGGVVVGGQATIGNPTPNGTVINQSSNSAIINWQQFNIGGNEYVQFIQPSSSSVVLNRVIGGSPSEIFGSLSANGRVFLINPNGVLFAPGAQLDVGGLVASTMNIKNADFLAGHYVFAGGSSPGSSVVNGGTIKTGNGGFVVLAGDYVKNTGVIQARLGQVVLASGSATTLELGSSGLVSFAVDKATLAQKAGVDNAGAIIADGGRVIMTAKTAHDLVGSAVNNSGVIRAQGIANHNGEIELTASGGDISDSGTLDASSTSGPGGTVSIAGDRNIEIQKDARILAAGTSGGKVSIVAEGRLDTRAGSLIDTHGAGGRGGQVELSGHDKLVVRGDVNAGSGGTLLIDPTSLTIANGNGSNSSATVYEQYVENQLKNDTDVQLVATKSITLANLNDGSLDGVNLASLTGGSLLLGIGTVSGGTYVEGTAGSIVFANPSNIIDVYGGLRIDAGSTGGTVQIGTLIGGNVNVKGVDSISAGAITATNGSITLDASNGNIAVTNEVASTDKGSNTNLSSAIIVSAGGGIQIGSITSAASNGGAASGAADASIHLDANTANLGGTVTIGSINADALSQASGTATASVDIVNHSSGSSPADIDITGIIVTVAQAKSTADGHVSITNNNGGSLAVGSVSTTALGSSGANADLTLFGSTGVSVESAIDTSAHVTQYSTAQATVTLGTTTGAIGAGAITTSAVNDDGANTYGVADASVIVNGAGTVKLSGISTSASAKLSSNSSNSAYANVNIYNGNYVYDSATNSNIYYGGDISTGNISTQATTTDTGAASGLVNIQANRYGQITGTVTTGTISTVASATSGSGTAYVTIDNSDGGIDTAGNDINTAASGGSISDDISLTDTGGGIVTANLGALNGAIKTVTSGSGGNISLGTLSGGNGALTGVDLESSGTLAFTNTTLSAGSIRLIIGAGDLSKGNLTATNGSIYVHDNAGSLTVGNISTTALGASGANADVDLFGSTGLTAGTIDTSAHVTQYSSAEATVTLGTTTGAIGAGAITTSAVNDEGADIYGAADAGVTINGAGAVTLNGISTSASAKLSSGYANSANADVNIYNGNYVYDSATSSYVYYGGAVSTGNIGTHATTTDNGQASALVNIQANRYGQVAGTVTTGTISAAAASTGGLGTAHVTIDNSDGGISSGTSGITIVASGASISDGITLTSSSGGGITTGSLSVLNGSITATSSGAGGNISLGTLSGGSGALSGIDLESSGTLAFTNNTLSAGSIRLIAGAGDLSKGNLTATNGGIFVHDNTGSLTLGNISATASGSYGASANVDLFGNTGLIAGTITANAHVIQYYDADATVTLGTTTGPLKAGAITTTALNDNSGNYYGSANAGITINAGSAITLNGISATATAKSNPQYGSSANTDVRISNGTYTSSGSVTTYYGGDISTGAINTSATAGNGSASSAVSIQANQYGQIVGTIITGLIKATATANNGSGTAYVTLHNADGGISSGSNSITATASGTSISDAINLSSSNGGTIITGNLSALGSSITAVSSGVGGNINLGTLSGGSGALTGIDLESSGTLAFTNNTLSAGGIRLIAGAGDLSKGDLTATNGTLYVHDNAGSLTVGNISATASGSYGANASVDLFGAAGLTAGTITSDAHVSQYYDANATVTLGTATGALNAGAIKTTALNDESGNYYGSAYAGVAINSAGPVTINGISTSATVSSNPQYGGSANADVNVYNGTYVYDSATNSNVYYGGDVSTGAIGTSATSGNGSASGLVNIQANRYGQVAGTMTTGDITTQASGTSGSPGTSIILNNVDGAINAGNLTALNSSITVTTSGAGGNIVLGTLSGGSGALSSVDLEASGSLSTASTSITAGSIRLIAGSGDFSIGDLTASNGTLYVHDNAGSLTVGNISTTASGSYGANADVDLFGSSGLTAGTITASAHVSQFYDADATVTLGTTTGALKTGAIKTTALNDESGNYYGSAYAGVTVNGAGTVTINGISTSATVNNNPQYGGSANADVNVYNGTYVYDSATSKYIYFGGNLSTGAIGTSASSGNGSASAAVDIRANQYGQVTGTMTTGDITTQASGTSGSPGTSITLNNANGAISAGNLTALNNSIAVTSSGAGGNIVLGSLSGGSANGDALTTVDLNSSGSLSFTNTLLTATSISLGAGAGDLSFGNLVATNGNIGISDTGGDINGGNITTLNGYLRVDAYNGGIADKGNIILGDLSTTSTGSTGANASIGVYSGGGLKLGKVTTDAESTGSNYAAYGDITLEANYHSQNGGALIIAGPVNATAKGGTGTSYGNAQTNIYNYDGSIDTGSNSVTANGSGATFNSDINLSASNGGPISTGDLTATNGAISASSASGSNGNGDIVLGKLSGGALPSDALTSVYLVANGGLIVSGDITAPTITLGASHGGISAGNITVTNNAFYVSDTGGSIALGDVSATGYISLSDNGGDITAGNLTALNDSISLTTYSGTGNISVGTLSGGSGAGDALTGVGIDAFGSLTTANTDIVARSISLSAGSGLLSTGNLSATDGSVSLSNSGGSIKVGNISASASSGEGATATITAYAAGGISTGSISTNAQAGSGAAAYVQMKANDPDFTQLGGDLVIGGPINTTATNSGNNGSADADVQLYNNKGAISTGAITAAASAPGGNFNGNIQLQAIGGAISSGALTVAAGGGISVSTSGSGDISVGQLSASGGGLSIVTLVSAGGLSTNGTDISTGQITLSAANGDLSTGNLTTTLYGVEVSDYGGSMTLGNVHSTGGVALYDSRFLADGLTVGRGSAGIKTGDLYSADNIFITTTGTNADGSGGNVSTGTLAANSGTLGDLDIESSGGIDIGGASHAATTSGVMTLHAGNGDVTTGDLTGTYSSVTVSGANGNIVLGQVTSDGPININNTGSSNNLNDTVVSNGNISTGDLADTSGNSITVTTTNFGDITVGKLSGSSGGSLGLVKMTAAGALKIAGPSITAGSITLSAGNGDLTAGDLVSTNDGSTINVTDGSGKITLGSVTANGDIVIHDGTGGIRTLDLAANAGSASIIVTSTGSAADIRLGTLSGGSVDSPLSTVSLISGGSLLTDTADITAGVITLSASTGDLNFGTLDALNGALSVNDGGGKMTLGSATASSDVVLTDSGGGIVAGNLQAGSGIIKVASSGSAADVKLGTLAGGSSGLVEVDLSAGGTLSSATTTITAGSIKLSAGAGTLSFGTLTANTGNLSVGNSGGAVHTGDLSATDGTITLVSGGAMTVGTVNGTGIDATAGGNAQFGDLDSSGVVTLAVNGSGNLKTGNITASQLSTTVGSGNEQVGNVTISGSNLQFSLGDVAGQTLSVGNLNVAAAFNESLACANCSISFGNVNISGGFSVSLGNGNLSVGNVTTHAGDIKLGSTHGSLAFGDLTGKDIALSTGQALTVNGSSINASGSFTLAAAGNTAISNSSIDAVSASITSGGTLGIDNSSVIAQTVALNASGALSISNNSLIGNTAQGTAIVTGVQSRAAATSSVSITSSGDVSVDKSTLQASQLSLNGHGIHLSNGATLNGDVVALTGTGAVDASGGSSSIDAGALSVRGGSIDFTDANLTVGSGSATFGSDAALLARIHARNPTLVLPTHGPNASFSAAGGVKLGKLSIAGGYLFIEAPSLQLPTTLSGNSAMFVDFLPSDPAALLSVNLTQAIGGITTLVFGGSPQSGNIQVGDGAQSFALTSNTNLVFATSGATLYPDSISTNGVVVVLGDTVLRTPPVVITDVPLTPDQYNIDQPNTGVLAYNGDQGDINDPGVNDANKGRIDIKTSTQQTLSCGIGGAQ